MNIGFTAGFSPLSTPFEVARSPQNQPDNQRSLQAINQTAPQKNNNQNGDTEQAQSPPKAAESNSPEARRQALSDPNSALYKELQALKNRDREVRTHEQAHLAAAGSYALGGPVYQYQRGPDGQRYAVGGHVNIDTSEVAGNPEATLRKADTVRRAALAPAEPSPQDRRVAAQASSLALDARQELTQIRQQEAAQARTERETENEIESESSDSSAVNSNDESRSRLEENLRNTGALGRTEPTLDLLV